MNRAVLAPTGARRSDFEDLFNDTITSVRQNSTPIADLDFDYIDTLEPLTFKNGRRSSFRKLATKFISPRATTLELTASPLEHSTGGATRLFCSASTLTHLARATTGELPRSLARNLDTTRTQIQVFPKY